jgi:hypothetical protein
MIMNKMLKACFGALLALTLGTSLAFAQQAGSTTVQQSPSRLDACQGVAYATGAVNTQITATIPVPAGNYAYICSIQADVCNSNTASTAIANSNFTSTNLPSNPTWQISLATTANLCMNPGAIRETFNGPPLKSSNAGTNVTIVSPAGVSQTAYTIRVTYYLAP